MKMMDTERRKMEKDNTSSKSHKSSMESVKNKSSMAETYQLQDEFHSVKVKIDFTAYAPQVFKYIRHLDGIDEVEIIKSISPLSNKF